MTKEEKLIEILFDPLQAYLHQVEDELEALTPNGIAFVADPHKCIRLEDEARIIAKCIVLAKQSEKLRIAQGDK